MSKSIDYIIYENKRYQLTYPNNSQDMNYHLYHFNHFGRLTHEWLIDICDISEDANDEQYYFWDDFKQSRNVNEIKQLAWKEYKHHD